LGIFLVTAPNGLAQEENIVKVSGVKGKAVLPDNKTLEEAKQEALKNAKTQALREAGISEKIRKNQMLVTDQTDQELQQSFNEISQIEVGGAIVNYSVTNTDKSIGEYDNVKITIEIDARVKKYKTGPDPSFDGQIEGMASVYKKDEPLGFSITPTQDAYLTIFNLGEEEYQIIYPLRTHPDTMLQQGTTYHSPFSEEMLPYKADISDDKQMENNRLVIVLTKQNIPYTWSSQGKYDLETKTSLKQVLSWINRIEPSKRRVYFYPYTVKPKEATSQGR